MFQAATVRLKADDEGGAGESEHGEQKQWKRQRADKRADVIEREGLGDDFS